MGTHTGIQWTNIIPDSAGATWNPIRATNLQTGTHGYICTKVSPGCDHCYASAINKSTGNGLEYPKIEDRHSLDGKVHVFVSKENQSSMDWPLRARRSQGIFPVSMSDWLGEFVKTETAAWLLATMLLGQHHIFLPLTKRVKHMRNLIESFTSPTVLGIQVPDTKTYDIAIIRARGIQKDMDWWGRQALKIFNNKYEAMLPWAPSNIIFGVSICTSQEAIAYLKLLREIRKVLPTIRLWVSQEPALDTIDWIGAGYRQGDFDWLVWGGESGYNARPATVESARMAADSAEAMSIPVFIKQFGTVLGLEMDLDWKGENIPDDNPYYVRQFPSIEHSYVPWR